MSETTDHKRNGAWLLHIIPIAALAALAVTLWRPAAEREPSAEQERKMTDLAALLGSTSRSARVVEDRLRSFGPFPPDPRASRTLAEALVTCDTTRLDETRRLELSQQLYGITSAEDVRVETVAAALTVIQHTMAASGCSPVTIDAAVRAARNVARTDPNPRREWW
jgi:hypothetical protein